MNCVGEKSALSGAAFSSPAKQYKVDRRKALRQVVHDFYREKKYPTLDLLLVAAKEKGIFSRERVTLWRVLRKMGFN